MFIVFALEKKIKTKKNNDKIVITRPNLSKAS